MVDFDPPEADVARRIFSLGAFDRFNYGDLLFPLVLDAAGSDSIAHLSLRSWDGTMHGGVQTTALHEVSANSRDSIIVAGGDILTANWFGAFWQLSDRTWDLPFRMLYNILGERRSSELIRRAWSKSDWLLPYIPPSTNGAWPRVAYNAVGGSNLADTSDQYQQEISRQLASARFVSVRDEVTLRALKKLGISAELAPDSVAGWQAFREMSSLNRQSVVTIQFSDAWARRHLSEIEGDLRRLITDGYELHFVPIGVAAGHSDRAALERLRQRGIEVAEVDVKHINDVLASIARSSAFVGSSLHGHITAVGTATPAVALGGVSKLRAYVDTWTHSASSVTSSANGIQEAVSKVMRVDPEIRHNLAGALSAKARKNTGNVIESVLGE